MSKLIYVVEDDDNIRDLVSLALEGNGYRVSAFDRAEECIEKLSVAIPSLIIFDIMLPGISGIEAVESIRQNVDFKKIPVIMLTAKDGEIDKIKGLDSGADDYMTKPFSIMELMARVRSILRRCEINTEDSMDALSIGRIKINNNTKEVFVDNNSVTLTHKEFELLKFLMENSHKVLSRDEILSRVWNYEYMGETRTVDIHIMSLRQKLGEDIDYIKTIRGMGYRFIG